MRLKSSEGYTYRCHSTKETGGHGIKLFLVIVLRTAINVVAAVYNLIFQKF